MQLWIQLEFIFITYAHFVVGWISRKSVNLEIKLETRAWIGKSRISKSAILQKWGLQFKLKALFFVWRKISILVVFLKSTFCEGSL